MPYERSDDLWAPLALLSLGLLAPGLVWALAGGFIGLYVSPVELTLGLVVGYGLLAWVLIDRGTVDQTSYLLVSLIWPWPLLFGFLFLLLLFNPGEQIPRGPLATIFRTITTGWPESIIGYGSVYMGTGVAVFVISRRYEAWLHSNSRLPPPSRLIPATLGVVVLIATVTAGANLVTSQSASIEYVGPGTTGYHDPTFNVTVVGPHDELRVTVVAPDGSAVTRRVSRAAMRGGSGTVPVPLDYDDSPTPAELPVEDGTYRVQVTSLAGTVVDTARFDVEDAEGGSLASVQVSNDSLPWTDDPFVYAERNASEASLGLTVTNEGAFHAEMTVVIRVPDDPLILDHIPMAPGDRRGVVFRLAPDTVDSIRSKTDGSVTVELYTSAYREDPVATTDVTLASNE